MLKKMGKSRLILVAVVVMGLASTGVALAAAGAFDSTGDVIAGGEPTPSEPMRLPSDETVLASGTSPIGGAWRITAFRSAGVEADGEVLEPKGAPCIRLMSTEIDMGTGYCGVVDQGFSVTSAPVIRSGEAEEIYYGTAPEASTKVRIKTADGKVLQAQTYEAVPEFPGDVWAIVASGPLQAATADWLGGEGEWAKADREVTSLLASSKLQ